MCDWYITQYQYPLAYSQFDVLKKTIYTLFYSSKHNADQLTSYIAKYTVGYMIKAGLPTIWHCSNIR